jgi:DNA-binding CsgD family transcriptional regulator
MSSGGDSGKAVRRVFADVIPLQLSISKVDYIGLGILWLWLNAIWTFVANPETSSSQGFSDPLQSKSIVIAAAALALLCAPLWAKAAQRVGQRRCTLMASAALTVGSALMATVFVSDRAVLPLMVIGGVTAGIGYAILLLGWVDSFCRLSTEEIEDMVPLCVIFEALALLVLACVHAPIRLTLIVAMPLLCGILLLRTLSSNRGPSQKEAAGVNPGDIPRIVMSSFKRSMALAFVSYSVIGYTGSVASHALFGSGFTGSLIEVSGILLATIIAGSYILMSIRVSFLEVYRLASPVLVLSLIACVFGSTYPMLASSILSVMANHLILIFLFIYFVIAAKKRWHSPSFAVGLTQGISLMGLVVGALIARGLQVATIGTAFSESLAALILIGAFVFAREMLPLHGRDAEVRLDGPEGNSVPANPLDSSCRMLAERHGLSQREQQLLVYLAQGRSRQYIQEALHLSRNTVASYAKTLYRKLSVHSKEELQRMVETGRERN